jgi:carboxymethylenebutenolidase
MKREDLEIRTPDGVMDCHLARPDGANRLPPVLLYMDGLGRRAALEEMAARLAGEGYVVLVPNLFYRAGAFAPFDPATVWTNEAERARLMILVQSVTHAGAMRDTAAMLDLLAASDDVAAGRVGCVGYCMGGGLALTAAATFPERIAAAMSFHGARLATDAPDSPHRSAAKIRGRVYIGVAETDRSFTGEQRERLRGALEAGGVRFDLEIYPGASHGFAVTDTPVYDKPSAERHHERVVALMRAELSGT